MMQYLKIWTSSREIIEPLQYDEIGRLFEMMLDYADEGKEPDDIDGNERFLWPVAKQMINLAAEKNETYRQNGSKGGRPKTKDNQPEQEETNENQTEPNETIKVKERKEKECKETEKEKKEKKRDEDFDFDVFWNAYPRHDSKVTARKAFDKLRPDEHLMQDIISAINRWKQSPQWQENGGQYIPYAATWLNQRRWEDEPPKPSFHTQKPAKPVIAQQYEQRDYSSNAQSMDDVLDMLRGGMR